MANRSPRCRSSRVIVTLGLWILCAASTSAQTRATTADLGGVILDGTGGVVAGASVVARNDATSATREVRTQSDGRFSIPALPPGIYQITAHAIGFGSQTREGVTLTLGSMVD